MRQNKYEYDAFISHAVEDKIPIANELCAKLESAGLRIWYSGKELGIGDSIEKTIEKGLNRSRYGIVIFSPTYLAKNWTIREFYTLLAKEIEEQKVILPVLYNISLDELKKKDLLMADRFAVNADRGIDFVVDRLVREIRKTKATEPKVAWFSKMWLFLALSLLANVMFLARMGFSPSNQDLSQASFSPWRMVHNSEHPPSLIDKMQGLLQQFHACSCPQTRPSPPADLHHRIVTPGPGFTHSEVETPGDYERKKNILQATQGKMTMAIVFQIETGHPEPAPEPGLAGILQTINPAGSHEPFLAVSDRDIGFDRSHEGCRHLRQDAD